MPKKESSVLLGVPDEAIEADEDVYASKIGGLPIWLDPDMPVASDQCQCKVCGDWMYLLFQSYAPLVDSAFHRVLYVWGCNKRECMKKEGSFSLVRSHRVDESYLKAQKQKEKRKREEEKNRVQTGFQLGDLWGQSAASFAKAAAQAPKAPLFGIKKKEVNTEDLVSKLDGLSLSSPPVDASILPSFPGQYLYIDQEPSDTGRGIDMSRYQEFLALEQEMEAGEGWGTEGYEKQSMPRGFDKQFQKFTERVELEPRQCVRYEFGGLPLFYSALSPQQAQQIGTPCPHCHGPRVFEFQLMPNVLSVLPTTEHALCSTAPTTHAKQSLLDRWSIGMEFGSILGFVCQKDCHPGQTETSAYMPETLIVQYEQD